MGELTGLLDKLINWFTRKKERHNRALRNVIDLSGYIDEFLVKYRLQEKRADFKLIFKNIWRARIDVATIMYQTRTRIKMARDIRDKDLPPLLEEVHNDLMEVKKALFNPTPVNTKLGKGVSKLRKSFKRLLDAISGIEYK